MKRNQTETLTLDDFIRIRRIVLRLNARRMAAEGSGSDRLPQEPSAADDLQAREVQDKREK